MALAGLIDTGAILAVLDGDDAWHSDCLESFEAVHLPLLTTEAVLTETFHIARRNLRSVDIVWQFVRSGAVSLRTTHDDDLPQLRALMTRYQDLRMDFADATLVHLANRESISLILTIDHKDFETYRLAGNRKFTILPRRRY